MPEIKSTSFSLFNKQNRETKILDISKQLI